MASQRFQALANEAALAAEHLAIGATAIGKANYAQRAYYYQAFFSLSLGIERSCKLALALDYIHKHGGSFPDHRYFRGFGHNLDLLWSELNDLSTQVKLKWQNPTTQIHKSIIQILSDFANNVTRYYNLEILSSATPMANTDPILAWFELVVQPCYLKFVSDRRKLSIERNASLIHQAMNEFTLTRHTSETGAELRDVYSASRQTGIWEASSKYVRWHVLQLCRFIGEVLSEQAYLLLVQGQSDIPHMSEFFATFYNSDTYLKSRKNWSIY